VQEKSGFVPNVFLTLAYRLTNFGRSLPITSSDGKGQRSLQSRARDDRGCDLQRQPMHYCVIAHGAILRIRAKNPQIAGPDRRQLPQGDITPRQRAMLDFAMKVSTEAHTISEADFTAIAATASATTTHGISRRSQRSSRCRTGWPTSPACAQRRILPDGAVAKVSGIANGEWRIGKHSSQARFFYSLLATPIRLSIIRRGTAPAGQIDCVLPFARLNAFSSALAKLASTLLREIFRRRKSAQRNSLNGVVSLAKPPTRATRRRGCGMDRP